MQAEQVHDAMNIDHYDEEDFVEFLGCQRAEAVSTPPPHVDAASWMLIQTLQQDEATVSAKRPPEYITVTKREGGDKKRFYYKRKSDSQLMEESDHFYAQKLEERFRREKMFHQLTEESDFAYAQQLAENWDEGATMEQQTKQELDFAYALQLKENWDYEQKQTLVKPPVTPQQAQESLDPATALKAYRYAEAKAQKSHNKALVQLQKRVQRLGFSQSKLDECLAYIQQEAPIIIHLKEETLRKLVTDTHYRSLFETNTSGGSKSIPGRESWERNMFGGNYDKCSPFLRPKYGCLNISGDIRGVRSAISYGPFVLTLKNDLRFRCTFFNQDTGNSFSGKRCSTALATYQYYAHILQRYPDDELRAALSVSRIAGAPSTCQHYKEVQIHGPIQLDSDIQALSVPGKQSAATATLKDLVEKFQKKTKCNILWQGDLLNPVGL